MANLLTNDISSTTRSVIRQLEDLLPQIEDGLARGYSHAAMHATLPALGINISLAYYHRALRLLRQERQAKKPQAERLLDSFPLPDASQLAANAGDTSESNLSGAIAVKASGQLGNISPEQTRPQPFRWKGQEFLNKDWKNF